MNEFLRKIVNRQMDGQSWFYRTLWLRKVPKSEICFFTIEWEEDSHYFEPLQKAF